MSSLEDLAWNSRPRQVPQSRAARMERDSTCTDLVSSMSTIGVGVEANQKH